MKKHLILTIGLISAVAINIYFRAFPAYFPQLKEQARAIAINRIYAQAERAVVKAFPDFSHFTRRRLVDAFVSQHRKENKAVLKRQIKEEYNRLKDPYQDHSGQTYLMELDCWHWARYVDNTLKYGHPGDKVVAGRQQDSLMLAPHGAYLAWDNFLYYLSAAIYRIFSFVIPVPLFPFLFYLPLFYCALLIVGLYLFCFYRWGNIAAWVASLSVGLSPVFIYRSCAGWFDKDIFTLLLPLLIIWAYIKAYGQPSFRHKFFWVFIAAFFMGLFCFSWVNWWFILAVLVAYELYSLLNLGAAYLQYKRKDSCLLKEHCFSLAAMLVFSLFWILLFCGAAPLKEAYSQIQKALVLNQPIAISVWPNVYATVGELRRSGFADIANAIGGPGVLILSLLSMAGLFLFTLLRRKGSAENKLIIILIFWFLSMSFASFKGVRFTMFLPLPLGISLGWALAELYAYYKKKRKLPVAVITGCLLFILSIRFIGAAGITARRIFPLMHDSWYYLLTNIKDNTPQDSVLNSWWDFGNWFKVVAERKVIFDGHSQNTPQAYWMARALISESEEEAVNILRMLNNSGNRAFESINEYLQDPYKSVFLLKRILAQQEDEARRALSASLPAELSEKVAGMIFSKPAPAYFIVDYSMQDKIPQISYLGNWDFAKSYALANIYSKKSQDIEQYLLSAGLDAGRARRVTDEAALLKRHERDDWISRRLRLINRPVRGREKEDIVLFDNGMLYNRKENSMAVYSLRDYRYKAPFSLFLAEEENLTEIIRQQAELDYSVLLIRQGDGYKAVSLDRALARSLFVRLYFLNARGLKYFKPFAEEAVADSYIRVFEVIW